MTTRQSCAVLLCLTLAAVGAIGAVAILWGPR